jgi:hypothetical protein
MILVFNSILITFIALNSKALEIKIKIKVQKESTSKKQTQNGEPTHYVSLGCQVYYWYSFIYYKFVTLYIIKWYLRKF